jgi:2-dehydro-3-deoxyphosphogluconate aldolase/(4S)-4-hydroxy-2-oxoglutarate aldolase
MTGLPDALAVIARTRVLPVVVIDDAENAMPLADALCTASLPIAEITLRTPAALLALARLAGRDDLLVGAGTVLTAEQARRAVDAGASFVVSPGNDDGVVSVCRARHVPVIPGAATASEIQRAFVHQFRVVKYFPAEANGGVSALSALSAPFGDMKFIPTGGISERNVDDYLALPSVLAVGGSWMVPRAALSAGRWDEISRLAAAAAARCAPDHVRVGPA